MSVKAKRYFDWLSRRPCVRCGSYGVEVAHVRAFRSPKTDDLLPRRTGIAKVAALPLCPSCHRTGRDSIHEVGEARFEDDLGRGHGYLTQKAASFIAEFYLS